MKLYLLIASALLWGCASSQPSPTADPHAGHDHATEATVEDPHAGHDHANGDSHEGHDHAKGDSHEGHDHTVAEKPSTQPNDHAEGAPSEIVFLPAQAAAIGLTTETVNSAKFESVIRCAGQINGAQGGVYTVTATADGIVSLGASTLSLGKRVTKGDILATVSARTMVGGDQNAKNELAYQTVRKEYERAQKLVADKIISDKEFEQIALNYETQKMAWQSSANGDAVSGVKIAAANGGYLTDVLVSNGQYVTAGTALATVSETQNLELRVDVPAKHASRLGEVRSANFLSSNGGQLYRLDDMSGRVLSYARTAVNGSAYLPLTFSFANRAGVVGGSFVEVFLMLRSPGDAISVPIASVIEEQGSHSVMVQLDAECYEKRLVQVGMNNGERVEVLRGLKPGEKVVAKGAYQVKMAASSSAIPDGHNH